MQIPCCAYPRSDPRSLSGPFYSRQKDTIDYTRASTADPWLTSNLSGLHFAGAESAVNWRVSRTSQLKFSWTLLTGAQNALHGLESEYVFNYPVNDGRAEWGWTPIHSLPLESCLGVVQRYQQTTYPVWDESLAREFGRIRPYVQLANLSNTGCDEILNVRMPGRRFVDSNRPQAMTQAAQCTFQASNSLDVTIGGFVVCPESPLATFRGRSARVGF